jgi:transposase
MNRAAIKPMLPNKPRGVPRVNGRRVLNGIFWVLRSGAPWGDLPEAFGPYRSRNEAKADVFDYIERFYNPKRRHSTIGYLSPMEFEQKAGLA